jgi:hypothetical protein
MKISQIKHESDDFIENDAEITENAQIFGQNAQNTSDFTQNTSEFTVFPTFLLENMNALDVIQRQFAKNNRYFELHDCPYPIEMRQFLKKFLGANPLGSDDIDQKLNDFFGDEMMYDRIIRDSKRAYMNLASQMTVMEAQRNIDDTVAFTKALANLQQRLLEIQEKAEGLKMIHEFKRIILSVIDTELTADQRTGIMSRISQLVKS